MPGVGVGWGEPAAYGSSQAMSLIGAVAAVLHQQPQQGQIQAMSVTYTTAHGNAGSLTHWARSGIEPISSWIPVRFVVAEPQQELQWQHLLKVSYIRCVMILKGIFYT